MSIIDQLGGIPNQYAGGASPAPEQATGHLQEVATQLPKPALSGLLASIFQSNETGSFGQNISSMFRDSNPQQRTGILSALGLSPATPASELSPEAAGQLAEQAQRNNPGIVQQAADFYAHHPQLVQALGTGAALWALQRVSKH